MCQWVAICWSSITMSCPGSPVDYELTNGSRVMICWDHTRRVASLPPKTKNLCIFMLIFMTFIHSDCLIWHGWPSWKTKISCTLIPALGWTFRGYEYVAQYMTLHTPVRAQGQVTYMLRNCDCYKILCCVKIENLLSYWLKIVAKTIITLSLLDWMKKAKFGLCVCLSV